MKRFVAAAAGALALSMMAAAPASALTFTTVGQSFTNSYDGFGGATPGVITGLTTDVTYALTGISLSGLDWTFSYSIHNTSSSPITASRVSVIGFDVIPLFSGASVTGIFNTVNSNNIPNFGVVDACLLKTNGNGSQCAGGGGTGVTLGATGGGSFVLSFGSAPVTPPGVQLNNLVVRYQSIAGAGPVTSAIGRPTGSDPNGNPLSVAPEPATWAMMILGFFGAGSLIRRRRHVIA